MVLFPVLVQVKAFKLLGIADKHILHCARESHTIEIAVQRSLPQESKGSIILHSAALTCSPGSYRHNTLRPCYWKRLTPIMHKRVQECRDCIN